METFQSWRRLKAFSDVNDPIVETRLKSYDSKWMNVDTIRAKSHVFNYFAYVRINLKSGIPKKISKNEGKALAWVWIDNMPSEGWADGINFHINSMRFSLFLSRCGLSITEACFTIANKEKANESCDDVEKRGRRKKGKRQFDQNAWFPSKYFKSSTWIGFEVCSTCVGAQRWLGRWVIKIDI